MADALSVSNNKFLLATYIDGPYFKSALEILLYPTGCSFYRRYSYRSDWVDGSAKSLSDSTQGSTAGFIGFRFKDSMGKGTRSQFVPLRKVKSIIVKAEDGFQVSFQLGDFVAHNSITEFISFDLSKEIPHVYNKNNDVLFTALNKSLVENLEGLNYSKMRPANLWEIFINSQILKYETWEENLNGISLLQLVGVYDQKSGSNLEPSVVESHNSHNGNLWAYKLTVGATYDLKFILRTLTPKGTSKGFGNILFESTMPEERALLSRKHIPQTGNYREESVWIQPRRKEPAIMRLDWEPRVESTETTNLRKSPPLRIAYRTDLPRWYSYRPGLIWGGLSLTILGALSFALAIWSSLNPCWPIPVIWVGIGGACAPIGANLLSKFIDEYSKLK